MKMFPNPNSPLKCEKVPHKHLCQKIMRSAVARGLENLINKDHPLVQKGHASESFFLSIFYSQLHVETYRLLKRYFRGYGGFFLIGGCALKGF